MFKLEKEHKAGIVSSLLATIFFIYFLQPILTWISQVVVKLMTITSTAFLDKIYVQAASLQTQDYSFLLLLFVIGIPCGFSTITLMLVIFGKGTNRSKEPEPKRIRIPSSALKTCFALVNVGFILAVFVFVSANFIQLRAIVTFKQQMRALAPYIDDAEEEQIFSRWSLMKSNSDYEKISNTVAELAKRSNLELPETALYTPTSL